MRGIVIAGTHSGCGKTTVTLGILAALKKRSLTIQPFKAGPDFIDTGLHSIVTGRPSRNLDQWMCGPDSVSASFARHVSGVDMAVIEGVMGMYDGDFSTASLANLLNVPVILVVDTYGMAESAGAVVRGFAEFGMRSAKCGRENLIVAGVIFNRVASENHYKRLKDSVRDIPVLGYLPRETNFEIPHRHLGLTIAEENPIAKENIDKLADTVLKYVDVDRLYELANLIPGEWEEKQRRSDHKSAIRNPKSEIRIAVASDKAFSFYYEDNMDLLRDAGLEIVEFSPLADAAIPVGVDVVYIGGGYPELHAGALARNTSMLKSIYAWTDAGKPLYAECGGLMYLSQGIHDLNDNFFEMAGVFSFETRMMKKPQLGYREIVLNEDSFLGRKGDTCRGHEFHYSEIMEMRSAECGVRIERAEETTNTARETLKIYSVRDSYGRDKGSEGYKYKNSLASYVHVHFGSNVNIPENFAAFINSAVAPK